MTVALIVVAEPTNADESMWRPQQLQELRKTLKVRD
jgi:hypothetical protein